MAILLSDTGSIRFSLEIADREAAVRGPIQVVTEDGRAPAGRWLASAAVEFWDPRDQQFWPFIRIPVLYLQAEEVVALASGVDELVAGQVPGFGWRTGGDAPVGLQAGLLPTEGSPEPDAPRLGAPWVVEVGIDLAVFLESAAGLPRRPGAELALFRFLAAQASFVRFGSELRADLGPFEQNR